MFRSSTIIRELARNLAKVIFTLKHSVKLRRYLLCGCVAAYHGMACVFFLCRITSLFIMQLCDSMSWNGVCVVCYAECTVCNINAIPLHAATQPHNK